jgi:hypothetical protein
MNTISPFPNYAGAKVLLGLSGGINSMAVLVHLSFMHESKKPEELHLFYAHLAEHSPDTLEFVRAGVEFAKTKFKKVIYKETQDSVLDFFERSNMIPHPSISPCTKYLKMIPISKYMAENGITHNAVGYVQTEKRRMNNMARKSDAGSSLDTGITQKGIKIQFPIAQYDDEWCLRICKMGIGWYPAIYDILDENGKRVFKHNNCMPCKNMDIGQLKAVEKHYPEYFAKGRETEVKIGRHWGLNADTYYTQFGRPEYEAGVGAPCEQCQF